MKRILFAMLMLCSGALFAQEKGMKFAHASGWEEIKAKAKAENKYIFLDAFTTWCGPCKMMSAEIFPLQAVGDFYNANYINVKVQMDETKEDNEEVKKWYEDAKMIAKDYGIQAYPTYLFFSPDGEIVHRAVGSSPEAEFIAKGKAALDPSEQYYTLKKKFQSGDRDANLLYKLAKGSVASYDRDFSPAVVKAYMATQNDLFTKPNLELLAQTTSSPSDPGFEIFRRQGAKADSILGYKASSQIVKQVAGRVLPLAMYPKGDRTAAPDWANAEHAMKTQFPDLADELLLSSRMYYYMQKKEWPAFREAATKYISTYRVAVNDMQLNNFAWAIFEECDDAACLQQALAWSKESMKSAKTAMFMDTYANLLYKTGKKKEAIKAQEEAVVLSKNDAGTIATLEKMKKGEQTW
ncbi:thioredoxin fold domain-containing protein [uncultured Chitinophaga sp.]|uniref:thioredoxin family protein n=1 Tax=uncultured Chitinophaga sp. TaxID=339340 RepID=UPI0025EBAC04|nr:thioredoxin fold domain-containing protein [uncultured Chitinophaga sp.]